MNKTRKRGFAVFSLVAACLVQGTIADPPRRVVDRPVDGAVDRAVDRAAARSHQRIGDPTSANLEAVAGRIVSERCNLLVVGDSIATHFALGERGSWVTGIWRTWKPDHWRGRFIPAEQHGDSMNGTRILNAGRSPGFDPNCEAIVFGGAVHPGEVVAPFDTGWWSLLGHPYITLGDLEDRTLQAVELIGELDDRSYWARYRSDPDWAVGPLRATAHLLGEPDGLDRLRLRARTCDGTWAADEMVDLAPDLPPTGTDLIDVSIDFLNPDLGSEDRGSIRFELRTDPDLVEAPGRSFFMLGASIERANLATGLFFGSNSIGGDTARAHLAEGDLLVTNGEFLLRRYTDDYLARFIERCGWDTFMITLGTNDLNAKQRSPEEVVADVARVIDRYRDAAAVARGRRPGLQEPRFLVVSPATAGSMDEEARFAALDAGVMALAGDDVGVIRLHELLARTIGGFDDYADQLLVDVSHPDQGGAMVKADLVWRELVSSIGRTPTSSGPLHKVPDEQPDLASVQPFLETDDVIVVGPGVHAGGLRIETPGTVVRSSHGAEETVLDGLGTERCLAIATSGGPPVELRDIALVDGRASSGGGVLVETGSLLLRSSSLSGCRADGDGGAIAVMTGDLRIESGAILDSVAGGRGGGIAFGSGTIEIEEVEIRGCDAGGDGGALATLAGSMVSIENAVFASNSGADGGAVAVDGTTTLVDVEFDSNTAAGDGGAIHVVGAVDLLGGLFRSNVADGDGGAILIDHAGASTISQVEFENNVATMRGGSVSGISGGTTSLFGCDIRLSGAGVSGGGLHGDCHVFDVNTSVFEGTASSECSIADIVCGELRLTGCVLCPGIGDACGTVVDGGGNEEPPVCDGICEGDLNLDGEVDGGDLGLLFAAWGVCPPASFCGADLDRNGRVDGTDLGLMLSLVGFGGDC